jgi:hypothetical protein
MKTEGSSKTWYLSTIYTVYNITETVSEIDQLAGYSKTMLHLPKLRNINGNDLEEDRDLFQGISIRLDGMRKPRENTVKIIGNLGEQNLTVKAWSIHTKPTGLVHTYNTCQSVFPFTPKMDAAGCSESW